MKRISLVLVLTILLTGCAAVSSASTPTFPSPPTEEATDPLLEPTDPTQLITVTTGEMFDIVVPANPSTGYSWNIIPELDENIVQFVVENFFAEQPVIVGSGGLDVWTFRAVNPGDTTIVLGYYSPTNANDPEETVTFSIHVE